MSRILCGSQHLVCRARCSLQKPTSLALHHAVLPAWASTQTVLLPLHHTPCPICQYGSCYTVRFLVPHGPLEHMTAHLRPHELQSTSRTCQDLRQAVLFQVERLCARGTHWFDAALDIPVLQRLPNLHTLRFKDLHTCFKLRSLSSLMQLHAYHAEHLAEAAALPHLAHLEFVETSMVEQSEIYSRYACRMAEHLQQMHALRFVVMRDKLGIDFAPQLMQLRTLFLAFWTPEEWTLDLSSSLVALQLLGLTCHEEPYEDSVIAPSCTCIKLHVGLTYEGRSYDSPARAEAPNLVHCHSLEHLQVTTGITIDIEVAVEKLLPQQTVMRHQHSCLPS